MTGADPGRKKLRTRLYRAIGFISACRRCMAGRGGGGHYYLRDYPRFRSGGGRVQGPGNHSDRRGATATTVVPALWPLGMLAPVGRKRIVTISSVLADCCSKKRRLDKEKAPRPNGPRRGGSPAGAAKVCEGYQRLNGREGGRVVIIRPLMIPS